MKKAQFLLWTMILVFASGCVEIRDANEAPQPMVEVQNMEDLVVDRPLFIFNGQIMDEKALRASSSQKNVKDIELSFDELRFTEGGVLYTMGANVRIHVGTLKAEGGKIATFPEGQKAAAGKKGRSGGHVYLGFRNAVGALTIELRGENGGDGLPAKDPDQNIKGSKGTNGIAGTCGFNPGMIPTKGGVGGKGLKGYPGNTGLKGGDSGTLELVVDNSQDFSSRVEKLPGMGGNGGPGGQGGEGGDGGDPGEISRGYCNRSEGGTRGPQGDPGDRGADGPAGEKQASCITKNQTMSCYY